ncbi:MAG: hypothetical protein HOK41_07140 [Nitrospina sp.]|nr:hypothetical protein [Nitrospina sp.]
MSSNSHSGKTFQHARSSYDEDSHDTQPEEGQPVWSEKIRGEIEVYSHLKVEIRHGLGIAPSATPHTPPAPRLRLL